MAQYLMRRVLVALLTVLAASVLTFSLIHAIPGDLVTILLGITASQNESTREALIKSLNLDKPLVVQYGLWLQGVLRADLGHSLVNGLSVRQQIAASFPVTLQLVSMAMLVAVLLGVPLGILSARRSGGIVDGVVRVVSLFFISTPAFFIGMLLILWLSHIPGLPLLQYAPFSQNPALNLFALSGPVLALGIAVSAIVLRFTRTSTLEALSQDYVRTARAKGLPERIVLYKHCLRNSAIPVLTVVGAQFIQLVGNLIVIERVFALPGVGQLVVNAIYQKDYTTIQGVLLVLVVFAIVVNLLLDLVYSALDPRVSYA